MKLSDLDFDMRLPKPPMVLVAVLIIGAFVPVGLASAIWYKRNAFDPNPRIHIFQDMDNQAKSKAQSASLVFADGRSMRAPAPGTVAYGRTTHNPDPGMLRDDDLAYRGFAVDPETGLQVIVTDANGNEGPQYLAGFPETVTVDEAFIRRGHERFDIYCLTCHGADGRGMGPTTVRWQELAAMPETGSSPFNPANLTGDTFTEGVYVNGRMFNTISHGQATMGPIGQQIPVEDRWAIIAYVRAMQRVQDPTHMQGVQHDHDGDGVADH